MRQTTDSPPAPDDQRTNRTAWTLASRIVSQACQFGLMVIAARVLSVADFGIFAILSATASGLSIFGRSGWREYIISSDDNSDRTAANSIASAMGFALMVLGILGASIYRLFGADTEIAILIGLFSVWIFLASASACPAGILMLRNRIDAICKAQVAGELLGLVAGALWFLTGHGMVALGLAKVTYQIIELSVLLCASKWYPISGIHSNAWLPIFRFVKHLQFSDALGFFRANIGLYVIGAIAGPSDTGIFRAGVRVAGSFWELLAEPIRILAWPTFRSASDVSPEALRRSIYEFTETALILATPFLVALAVLSKSAIAILLGDKWISAAPVVTLLSLANLVSIPSNISAAAVCIANRPDVLSRLSLASFLFSLVLITLLAPYGPAHVSFGQLVCAVVFLCVTFLVHSHLLGLSVLPAISQFVRVCFAATLMAGTMHLVRVFLTSRVTLESLLSEVAVGSVAYFSVVWFLFPGFLERARKYT